MIEPKKYKFKQSYRLNKRRTIVLLYLILFVFGVWLLRTNTALETREYLITGERIPQAFNGFRIAQVSDLHNTQFGEDNKKLIEELRRAEPDIIVITGDMIDSRRTNIRIALDFAKKILKICPVYYVSGNHESRVLEYGQLISGLEELGVTVLENGLVELADGPEMIVLMGLQDPAFQVNYLHGDSELVVEEAILSLHHKPDVYTVLLSHRPELFETYAGFDIDLVLSGHTHGGQFRLPFVGGVIAPNQGFFPAYDAGRFVNGKTTMIISRGVGNSIFPIRFNNRPEIVVAELKTTKEPG